MPDNTRAIRRRSAVVPIAQVEEARGRRGVEPGGRAFRLLATLGLDQHQIHQPMLVDGPPGEGGRARTAAPDRPSLPVGRDLLAAPPGESSSTRPVRRRTARCRAAARQWRTTRSGRIVSLSPSTATVKPSSMMKRSIFSTIARMVGPSDTPMRANTVGALEPARGTACRARVMVRRAISAIKAGVLARRRHERAAGQGQNFGIPHGENGRCVGRAGDQRHLAGRFTRLDHAEELLAADPNSRRITPRRPARSR